MHTRPRLAIAVTSALVLAVGLFLFAGPSYVAGPSRPTCWTLGGSCMEGIPILAPDARARLDACFNRFLACCRERGTRVEPGQVNSPCVSNCKVGAIAFEVMKSKRSCLGLFASDRCAKDDEACRSRAAELLAHCTKRARLIRDSCAVHCR